MPAAVKAKALRGLYAITPERPRPHLALATQVDQAILGGARLIQYRDKSCDSAHRLTTAQALLQVCRVHQVPLLINDDLELAIAICAAGVHLGQEDIAPNVARQRLGPEALIGVSCYNRLDLAEAAQAAGADYVAFGRFFPSATKPLATKAAPEILCRAKATLQIPIVAIGGINHINGQNLISLGADMLAVVEALFKTGDIKANAQAFGLW